MKIEEGRLEIGQGWVEILVIIIVLVLLIDMEVGDYDYDYEVEVMEKGFLSTGTVEEDVVLPWGPWNYRNYSSSNCSAISSGTSILVYTF